MVKKLISSALAVSLVLGGGAMLPEWVMINSSITTRAIDIIPANAVTILHGLMTERVLLHYAVLEICMIIFLMVMVILRIFMKELKMKIRSIV